MRHMSKEGTPSPDEKHWIQAAYVEQHAKVRLNHWAMQDGSSALVYLHESGHLKDVLGEATGPLLQACENQSRHDPQFSKLLDGSVDIILARVVQEKQLGTLQSDTLGRPLFKPWSLDQAKTTKPQDSLTVGDLSKSSQ